MAANAGLGIDVGSSGGQWLFKQGDLLLGPVPFTALVEMLFAGELDANTPVRLHGSDEPFKPVSQIPQFTVHLAKAQAKRRVEASASEKQKLERRGRNLKLAAAIILALGVLYPAWLGASWLAIHQPWRAKFELAEPTITDEIFELKLASAREADELAYPDARAPRARPTEPGKPKPPTPAPTPGQPPAKPGTAVAAAPTKPAPGAVASAHPRAGTAQGDDDVQVVQQWDKDAIFAIVRSNKTSLHRCLKAESARQKEGWEARIPIEFTIGNDGRVSKLWIDNPDYKAESTELFVCMLGELKKWKFPSFQGEQPSVPLTFNIKR